MRPDSTASIETPSPITVVALAAMAGALGWGIRGQYGHETGAMVAGVLVSLVLCRLLCPRLPLLTVARAVAWCTVAIGFGGSMTYGQTIGLTQNAPVIGNWSALSWGMLGLAIKGALWIGFGGAFLGIGLGGKRYRSWEMLLIMLGLLGLSMLGRAMLNEPFDPAHRQLPQLYFSAAWEWEPGAEIEPRREYWGGMLFALLGLLAYVRGVRRDRLAWRIGLWGLLGGAIGFPLGQCVQAAHAWNLNWFQAGIGATVDPYINWWNFMETTFGATMGALLGLGLWLNRRMIQATDPPPTARMPAALEWGLIVLHLLLLVRTEFGLFRSLPNIYGLGLILGTLPVIAIASGRLWPFWMVFPITAVPIAGKTLRNLVYEHEVMDATFGTALYVILPLTIATLAAIYFARQAKNEVAAISFLRWGLTLTTLMYFGLNFAFFRYPWPWETWTPRTPNAIVFTLCAVCLLLAAARPITAETAGAVGETA